MDQNFNLNKISDNRCHVKKYSNTLIKFYILKVLVKKDMTNYLCDHLCTIHRI